MKTGDVVDVVAHFTNDVIGNVGPGIIFLFGLNAVHFRLGLNPAVESLRFDSTTASIIALALAYAAGHGLLGVHTALRSLLGRLRVSKAVLIAADLKSKLSYRLFRRQLCRAAKDQTSSGQEDLFGLDFHDHRSIAMTLSPEGGVLARRFMFISLFCYGISKSLLLLTLYTAVLWPSLGNSRNQPQAIGLLIVALSVFWCFESRGEEFERRALGVPFSVAISEINFEKNVKDNNDA